MASHPLLSPLCFPAGCKSATYCSVECQKTDWAGHKKICKILNAGRAGQLRHPDHTSAVGMPQQMISGLSCAPDECREIFRLFRATKPDAETRCTMMLDLAGGMSMSNREFLLFQSIGILLGLDSDIIAQPTSPVLVLLESGVDPNFLSHPWGGPPDDGSSRPLHMLVNRMWTLWNARSLLPDSSSRLVPTSTP